MRKISLIIWSLIATVLVACTSQSMSRPELAPTPTPTSFPSTDTPSPFFPPGFDSNIILYRGNPQRTGIYDIPSIRHQPEVKWQAKVGSTWLMPPMLADGILYTGSGNGFLYALNAETGEQIWSVGGFGQLECTGAIAGDMIVAGGYGGLVQALDRHNGDVLWSYKTGGDAVSEPVIADDVVYVSDSSHEFPRGSRHLYALDAVSGEELWMFETVSTFLPAPALGNGVIYVTSTGEVLALK